MNEPEDELTEAVLFLRDDKVYKEMLFSEFEAVLDGVVGMLDCAGREELAVFVQISPMLDPVALVFFVIQFNEHGDADSKWNLPLRTLIDQAGGGVFADHPVGLVDSKHCALEWALTALWSVPGKRQQAIYQELVTTLKRNKLGVLGPSKSATVAAARKDETAEAARAKEHSLEQDSKLREAAIEARFDAKATQLQIQHQEQLNSITSELTALRTQLEAERKLAAERTAVAVGSAQDGMLAELEQRLRMRDTEIDHRDQQIQNLREHLAQLRRDYSELLTVGGDQILMRMTEAGVSFVAYPPGVDHLAIGLKDITAYLEDPTGYVAQYCGVETPVYELWLRHFRRPVCQFETQDGQPCGIPIEKVAKPAAYQHGQSNLCLNHGGV